MSSFSVPIALADWHGYRLCQATDAACNSKASLYAAGQVNDATDGTDLGFNTSAIDAAETSTQYVCGSTCGSPGPYPDSLNSAVPSFSNIDDNSVGTFGNCGLSCAGGTGSGTSVIQTFNNASPSLDGGSMNLGLTGPSLSAGQTTNWLWYWHGGASNTATTFSATWHVYIPSIALIGEMEFDQHLFAGGHRWFWGSECAPNSGVWKIWDQLHGTWITTSVSCTLTAATWHTVTWNVHRVVGDGSCASGNPCDYYDSLYVDGVNVTPAGGFPAEPSGPTAEADDAGTDTQIDMNSTGGTTSAYYDEMTFNRN
jgi:hypothetical protein